MKDFETKMADYENAKAAVDAVMTGQAGNENAPAEAEAVESAAQTEAEGAQIKNGNAQIENGNAQNEVGSAQAAEESVQNAEKPDLYAVQEKAARGLDKLTDAELQVYTEYMQRQVEQSENSQGYADNLKKMLREGLADAQAEAQRRGEASETVINKTGSEEDSTSFSVDMSGTEKKVPHGLVLDAIRSHFSEVSSDQAVKSITGNEFQKTDNDKRSLKTKIKEFFESLGNKVTREGLGDIALNSAGVHDSLEHGYGPLKAATFEALPDVLKKGKLFNADPDHALHPYDSYLIVAPVNVGTGSSIKRCYVGAIVIRDVNTQRYKIHEVLTETENGTSSDKSEAHPKGSGLRYDVPSKNIILQTGENSNPKNESRDLSQIGEAAENETSEKGGEQAEAAADLSQNQKSAENETAEKAERTAAEIRKEIRQAENEYSEHADAGDEEYDYRAQLEKIKALREEAEEAEAGEKETGEQEPEAAQENTEKAENSAAETSVELETRETAEEAKKDLLEVGEGRVKNDTGDYTMKLRLKRNGMYLASVEINGRRDAASTFHSAQEAAEWAEGYVKGQTRAREDAALDRHKSKKELSSENGDSPFSARRHCRSSTTASLVSKGPKE